MTWSLLRQPFLPTENNWESLKGVANTFSNKKHHPGLKKGKHSREDSLSLLNSITPIVFINERRCCIFYSCTHHKNLFVFIQQQQARVPDTLATCVHVLSPYGPGDYQQNHACGFQLGLRLLHPWDLTHRECSAHPVPGTTALSKIKDNSFL
jgi:hypothetical protein